MSRMLKFSLILGLFLTYLLWLTVSTWPDSLTRVIFCDVGQGDATLVTRGTMQVLIDGGPDEKVLECLSQNLPWWDRRLEMVIATHADADHITGLTSVFKAYSVESLIMTDQQKTTEEYQAFLTQIRTEPRLSIMPPKAGKRLVLGPMAMAQIIWPRGPQSLSFVHSQNSSETHLSDIQSIKNEKEDGYNDGSIALYIVIGKITLLLTGDLETKGEEALVANGLTKQIMVLKAGHHGSKTSSTMAFIGQVQPEFTIISCGLNNRFGHPAPEVLSRLEEVGSRILRTDQVGTITLISDGQDYWFDF